MITILRIIAKFFRTWFMPMPAHDAYQAPPEAPADTPAHRAPDASPAEGPSSRWEPTPAEEAVLDGDAAAEAANRDFMEDRPSDDEVLRSGANLDFTSLVKPPEGSEERMGRSYNSSMPLDAGDDTAPAPEPAPTPEVEPAAAAEPPPAETTHSFPSPSE